MSSLERGRTNRSGTANDEDEANFKQIAESIVDSVWNDPELTSYKSSDEDRDTEIEILDPELVNPDIFDWQAHDLRIKKLLSYSIRSYVRNWNNPLLMGKELTLENDNDLEREKEYIKHEYKKIFEKMRKSIYVKKVSKITMMRQAIRRRERKILLEQIKKERGKRERRRELELEAENVVDFWLGSIDPNKTISAAHVAEKIVAQHIEQMEKFMDRRDKIFDQRTLEYVKAEVALPFGVDTIISMERKMKSRLHKLKRIGSRSYLIFTLLKKWLKTKLITLNKLEAKDPVCKRCQENEAIWRSYRREHGYTDRLTREDGRRFHSMLVRSGEMRILIDYFKILLSKPTQNTEELVVKVNEESSEDNFIDSLIYDGCNKCDNDRAEECLLCNEKCERRTLPWLCSNK